MKLTFFVLIPSKSSPLFFSFQFSQEVAGVAKKYNVDYRTAGLISAMNKMATVHGLAGLRSGPQGKQ